LFTKTLDKPIISHKTKRIELFHDKYCKTLNVDIQITHKTKISIHENLDELDKQRIGEINCYLKFIKNENLQYLPEWFKSSWEDIDKIRSIK